MIIPDLVYFRARPQNWAIPALEYVAIYWLWYTLVQLQGTEATQRLNPNIVNKGSGIKIPEG